MSKYQQKVISEHEQRGYGVIKLSKTNKNGIADLLVSKTGETPTLIEVKEKNDTLKPLQIAQNLILSEKMGFNFVVLQDGKGQIDISTERFTTDLF